MFPNNGGCSGWIVDSDRSQVSKIFEHQTLNGNSGNFFNAFEEIFFLIEGIYAHMKTCRSFRDPFASSHAKFTLFHGKHIKHQTTASPENSCPLDVGVVRDGGDGLGHVALDADHAGVTGHRGLSLQVDVDALLLSLALLDGVLLDTVQELLTGAGVRHVLDADVDALLDVAVADTLVDDDADGGLGHVVDHTSLAVVVLVGHTAECLSQQFLIFHFHPTDPGSLDGGLCA